MERSSTGFTQDEFGDVATHSRALLEPVTGEPVGEIKTFQLRPLARMALLSRVLTA
jgi:hypothetical protein